MSCYGKRAVEKLTQTGQHWSSAARKVCYSLIVSDLQWATMRQVVNLWAGRRQTRATQTFCWLRSSLCNRKLQARGTSPANMPGPENTCDQ